MKNGIIVKKEKNLEDFLYFLNLKRFIKVHLFCKEIIIAYNSGNKEKVKTLVAERETNIKKEISKKLWSLKYF